MSGKPNDLLRPLVEDPGRSALLCDVDGTLSPITELAYEALVPENTRRLLAALADRVALVALVSGRQAADVRRMVAIDEAVYLGNHGFERLDPGEDRPRLDPALAGREADAAELVGSVDSRRLADAGLRIEDKGAIQALHWRGAEDESAAEALAEQLAVEANGRGLATHRGRKILELRPPVPIDKGRAVSELLRERGIAHAAYAGDDRTDLDAFRAIRAMREGGELETALCIGVASDEAPAELEAEADLVIDGPDALLPILEALAGGG